jgi:hypothetical protein
LAASKSESRNPKFETNSKHKCSNVQNRNPAAQGFGHLNLDHWKLPFDVAQGGEPVEPFRISPAFAEAAMRRQVLRISSFFRYSVSTLAQ